MKKIILVILAITLVMISCKKKDDDTSPTAPKTTLSERAGTYEAIYEDNTELNITFEIKADGTFVWTSIVFTKLDPTSTATSFTVKDTQTGTEYVYLIDFANNKFIGSGTIDNLTRTLTKK